MSEFSYQYIDQLLQRYDDQYDTAECHGAISAVQCVMGDTGFDVWSGQHMASLHKAKTDGDALASQLLAELHDWYEHILQGLGGENFEFRLCLPADDVDLAERIEALRNWCQGFLLGLSFAGMSDARSVSEEVAELIDDISQISQIEEVDEEDSSDDENDFMELVEYLRVGVMLFYETVQKQPSSQNMTFH